MYLSPLAPLSRPLLLLALPVICVGWRTALILPFGLFGLTEEQTTSPPDVAYQAKPRKGKNLLDVNLFLDP